MVVGSNGIITFEQICANQSNAYTLSSGGSPQPIPYNVGAAPGGIGTTYYPRTAIMGAYHDIDPSASPLPTRRIEYNVFGSAPCRKLVVSYFDIKMFSCTNLICTEQMVLHESTGIIEVFLLNKPICPSWPSGAAAGLAILGIQDHTRTKAVAAPGKNCTQWSESNTGYRFTPSGGGSRYVISELLTLGGTVVSTADTSTTTAGLLDVAFTNFCAPPGSNQYVVRTTFSACDNPANLLVSLDTITINRTNTLNATSATTNATCGPSNGTITVTVPAGVGTAPYTFVLDGTTTFIGASPYTFTGVAPGPHTVVVTDASAGCTSTLNMTVNLTNGITANTLQVPTACTGINNGQITVTPTSGTGPWTYSLDGAPAVAGAAPYTFTGVAAGPHTIVVTDAANCTSNIINVNVGVGSGVSATATPAATSCPTAANGTIVANATAGTAPFTYQLDGGGFLNGANPYTFSGVSAGPHTVIIKDNAGCTLTINVNVAAGAGLTANAAPAATSCSGASNGTITVTPTNGSAPYTFSLDGAPGITAAAPYTFNNVAAGPHTVIVTDGAACVLPIRSMFP